MNELDKLHYKACYFCGRHTDLHRHHIYFGANRKVSERIGAWVYLCSYHHNMGGKDCVHENREMDLRLKRLYQRIYELEHTRASFISEIGKNYLFEDEGEWK